MNVLIVDAEGCGLDFSLRCSSAGHHAKLCIGRDKTTHQRSHVGDNLCEKIESELWQPHMKWADIVVLTENTRWLREIDVYRKKGFPVFGPSKESAELELDRDKGQKFLKKAGIKTIPYSMFSDYAKAEKYVLERQERFVSKPNGNKDKALSYVSKSPADMLFMLRRWRERNKEFGPFMLQEHVEGIEFAVNGWLGKEGFASFIEESWEHKKFMNDDKAMNCGEQGTVIKYVKNSSLAKEILLPLERDLIRIGHTGSVDVSAMIDEDGIPRPLEFTCRLGWPAFNIVQPLHPDPCEWMAHLLDGEDTFRPLEDIAVGVVVTLPPWPNEKIIAKDVTGIPVYGLDDDNPYRPYISPCELMSGEAPAMEENKLVDDKRMMVSAGAYLCVATGLGNTVREAKKEAYAAVDSMEIPLNPQLRTDIGDGLKIKIPKLQDHGFALDWEY